MEVYRRSSGLLLLLGFTLLATTLQGVQGEVESEGPSESECRPYIEKALKELEAGEAATGSSEAVGDNEEDIPTVEITDDSGHQEGDGDANDINEGEEKSSEIVEETKTETKSEPEKSPKIEIKEAPIEDKTKNTDASYEDQASVEETHGDETEDKPLSAEEENKSKEDERELLPTEGESKEGDSKEDEEKKDETESLEQDGKDEGDDDGQHEESTEDKEESKEETGEEATADDSKEKSEEGTEGADELTTDEEEKEHEATGEESKEEAVEQQTSVEEEQEPAEEEVQGAAEVDESTEENADTQEEQDKSKEQETYAEEEPKSIEEQTVEEHDQSQEDQQEEQAERIEEQAESKEGEQAESKEEQAESKEEEQAESKEGEQAESKEEPGVEESKEEPETEEQQTAVDDEKDEDNDEDKAESQESAAPDDTESKEVKTTDDVESKEEPGDATSVEDQEKSIEENQTDSVEEKEESEKPDDSDEKPNEATEAADETGSIREKREVVDDDVHEGADGEDKGASVEESSLEDGDVLPVEELSFDVEMPTEIRSRDHVEKLLKLDEESSETENVINQVNEYTLKGLKKLYEHAIKPLENLYKYRDLSNRHFGDAEIFSKPLILFMGPWSGGKSSIINYLLNIEYNETALRTGAEPSPAYFNILMHGDEPEILDGTELAADFTFSGLQKFGQGLEERLRGVKLPVKLLEKVNIVEIPGILEVRKQVSRVFPFNDACQWFIDRADIIFLVYDPSKLDVGPETEAILDQLKGREHQTRIVLNKADQVKPEELLRVQGALIWNISPLMSSPQPPVMYTTSLWSRPYEPWAPGRLLQAQERAFLRDFRSAIDKRIENKIASARRFAVRVRNHAKMVDCYLTTYYNHKSVFGNRKQVADTIIEHPQDYHIYEGLSTLTNISRYDLPDPDVYKDFFKLNPLYEFQQLSATCTYFRGCPINRLDIAIAYDLPELVGTHKKLVENALSGINNHSTSAPGS